MSGASGDFLDHEDIASLIVERRGALAVLEDGREVYPLYEGKMFWHFDHRYGTYEGQTQKQANKGVLPRVLDVAHGDPTYQIQPRYWVDASLTDETLGDEANHEWFFTWRELGPSERTFVCTIIPRTAAGHKAPVLTSSVSTKAMTALMACLGSLVVDYSARQKGTGMSFFLVEQLPVPLPCELKKARPWLETTLEEWLADRVLELCYTNEELAPLAAELGRDHPPFCWQPDRRAILQAEIDAAVLHLYGLDRSQVEWLLNSFSVLRKYEERDHGEFRTKRLVLELYDEMAAAKEENRAFKTHLDPGPADPRCCFPKMNSC